MHQGARTPLPLVGVVLVIGVNKQEKLARAKIVKKMKDDLATLVMSAVLLKTLIALYEMDEPLERLGKVLKHDSQNS